ncbi:MAG TPA: GNAT family N-acetyltransferase [Roseiarcus sp.]|nr:GNAT family N-acetyltransferase [Roseiarcus sp.]
MSRQPRNLRLFVADDLPALADLWVAAWRETGLPIDFEERRPWVEARLSGIAADRGAIIVGLGPDGPPAGFVTIDLKSGYLDQLCVAPAERGSGLARALLNEAKRLSPSLIELDVNEANPRALSFYKRERFKVAARGVSETSGLPTLRMRWRASR